ncbi:MAG: hypothetical protein QF752_14790 [Planctomycetota bacterium]|nr:hypothetical protein [Planctomycetota bacterium]
MPHAKLFTEKGGTAFPRFLILDSQGRVLVVGKGARTVEGFRSWIEQGQKVQKIFAKSDPTIEEQLLMLETRLSVSDLTYEEAMSARKRLGNMNEAQEKRYQKLLMGADARSLLNHTRRITSAQRVVVGGRLLAHLEAGRIPTAFSEKMYFFDAILDALASAKNLEKYRSVLEQYNASFGRYPNVMKRVAKHRKRLEEMSSSTK